jgi:hypothetical protein
VRQPRRQRRGDKAHQAVQDELENATVRPPRTVQQFRRAKRDHTNDQQPDTPANSFDVEQNIIHRAEHQRRPDAEQIAVLKLRGEDHEQLCDLRQVGVGPVAGHQGVHQQQQEPAEQRPQGRKDQIPLHGTPRVFRIGCSRFWLS